MTIDDKKFDFRNQVSKEAHQVRLELGITDESGAITEQANKMRAYAVNNADRFPTYAKWVLIKYLNLEDQ